MANIQGRKKIAASYRVKEPIRNFKIRVRVAQQKSLLADLFDTENDTRDPNYLEEDERIFRWQEKIFSPFEIEFYNDEKNCVKESQRKYHELIKEKNLQASRLYTYTETDTYYPDENLLTKPYQSYLSIKNQFALPAILNRKPFTLRYNKNVIDDRINDKRIRSNHYFYMERSTMYILVDLSGKDKSDLFHASDVDTETLLCRITYDKMHNILTMYPDFTSDESYMLTTDTGIRYDYWLEHISEIQSTSELEQQQEELRQEMQKLLLYKAAEIPNEIEVTVPNILQIFLNINIVSAHNFSYNGLFITYYIVLPKDWSTKQKERLIGRTQKCYLKDKTAYFDYIMEILLDLHLNILTKNAPITKWPSLLISVASLDSWTRYRIEGYGVVPISLSPGGTYELEDITHCGIPPVYESTTLDKSNLKVVSSGYVKINMNIVHRYNVNTINTNFESKCFERENVNALMNNVENVFEQFKAARERMLQIRNANL
ncbi:Meckel syndrome type 1 protein-like isoform X2 [Vespula pensylvanica]|uniref:Meckel syndrome type 1 protein-like isoform X2 n=1 Tax=Vespula pensylvanica TaxID=30213 RepID=UPI001CBA40FE|nr:Meckel syndrome type 1 protein-like isoform X2 [Vespula pensylvanica]